MKIKAFYISIVFAIVAFLLSFLCVFECMYIGVAKADSVKTEYTDVLDDLEKVDSFNVANYPEKSDDYTMSVITVAESTNFELFVYVYQPSAAFVATSINLSPFRYAKAYDNYKLSLLNSNGVFYKYRVEGFKIFNSPTRYYEISSIFRVINKDFGDPVLTDNVITEMSYPVGKLFEINEENGTFEVFDVDLITITDKYVGLMRYLGDYNWWGTDWCCDSHYIAFSTDKPIDTLYEADIFFGIRTVTYQDYIDEYDYGDYEEKVVHLNNTQNIDYHGGKFRYLKERIQTVEDFIQSERTENEYDGKWYQATAKSEITEEAISFLKGKQWVVRFYETDYRYEPGWYGKIEYYTEVSNVSVLRLKFETAGETYNLGVVDTKQTGSGNPGNDTTLDVEINDEWLVEVLAWLIFLVLLVIVAYFCPFIFKILWWIICLPFKLLWWLIKGVSRLFKKNKKPPEDLSK